MKNLIEKNFHQILFLLILLTNSFIFRFKSHFALRDFISLPYYYNLEVNRQGFGFFEGLFFNFLVNAGIPYNIIHSLFYSLIFSFGLILSALYLIKLGNIFISDLTKISLKYSRLFTYSIAFLYVYNPFTLERFLMGQYNVLRGYMLFIPAIYFILKPISFNRIKETLNIETIFSVVLIIFIGLWSPHTWFMLGIIFCVSIVHFLFTNKTWDSITINRSHIINKMLFFGLVSFPGIFQLANRTLNGRELDFYSRELATPESRNSIIRAFSLDFYSDRIPFFDAFIGMGSWMSQSISYERELILQVIGDLSWLTLYYSLEVSVLWVILVLGFLIFGLIQFKTSNTSLTYLIAVTSLFAFVLNFGYYGSFELINSFFFRLPLSYIMREAGKFYQLFRAGISILLFSFILRVKSVFMPFVYILAYLGVFSSILPFFAISSSLRYFEYPQIYNRIEKECTSEDSVLYLPPDIYSFYEYTEPISTPRHAQNLVNCPVANPNSSLIITDNNVIVNATESDSQWIDLIQNLNSESLNDFITETKASIIVLNTHSQPEVEQIYQLLTQSNYYEKFGEEQSIRVFIKVGK